MKIQATINLPDYIKKIISLLEKAGYEAFAVGGCVRDALIGLTPLDYDITTSATPEEVRSALENANIRVHDTGLKHGTVTAVLKEENANENQYKTAEITTFRIDGNYSDNRRPDDIRFARKLEDDLSRRDFTINAMAYSDKTGVIDLFHGLKDLENKIIRTVGEPEKRFNEDGLRILRALRFACVYNLEVEEQTACAILGLKGLLQNISGERKAQELNKLILGEVSEIILKFVDVFAELIPEIKLCENFNQRSKYHDRDVLVHTLNAVDSAPKDKIIRLALLFHDMGKPATFTFENNSGHFRKHAEVSVEIARKALRRLKYDNDTFYKVLELVKYHDIPLKSDEKSVKRLLNRFGEDMFFKLVDVHLADNSAKSKLCACEAEEFIKARETAREVIKKGDCFSLKQLAVKGGDLVELGYKNAEIGQALNKLLQAVINGECENEKEKLLKYLK